MFHNHFRCLFGISTYYMFFDSDAQNDRQVQAKTLEPILGAYNDVFVIY